MERARYGLVGQTLGHSFSPQLHRELSGMDYALFELRPEQLEGFLRAGAFDGVNVTIPYKKAAMAYCDRLTGQARRIGSVNTILRRPDGTLVGHNTDYDGVLYLLRSAGAQVEGKKALVLGSGGASLAVRAALSDLGAGAVVTISRSGADHYGNLERHRDAAVIVNATPVGMYPDNEGCPLSLDGFPVLEGVFDLIYNPGRTQLLLQAGRRGLIRAGGLGMLAAQAWAAERFWGIEVPERQLELAARRLEGRSRNILLIGMPGCGKSAVGQQLARRLGRPLADLDHLAEQQAGRTIPQIFQQQGEEAFRRLEHQVLLQQARRSGIVIAAGGGVVTRPENLDPMRWNSTVVFLRRDLARLPRDGRPLSQREGVERLYRQRLPLYQAAADLTVDNTGVEATAEEIIRRLGL